MKADEIKVGSVYTFKNHSGQVINGKVMEIHQQRYHCLEVNQTTQEEINFNRTILEILSFILKK
jgi:hypothetical protein